MAKGSDFKVHLDHLIPRESLRWIDPHKHDNPNRRGAITKIKFNDLAERPDTMTIFPYLRKPDFQRETSAWSPQECVSLLESIVKGWIIPSLIVWKSPDNSFLYILDGAHRISVMRAWLIDDWGDHADEDYYERHEYQDEIRESAEAVRLAVKMNIGSYEDYLSAGRNVLAAMKTGFPGKQLSGKEYERGSFYTDMVHEAGFHIQEVSGDFDVAEASFLRINRSGQPLNEWETKLIENRKSSFARAVMSVANGGTGRFWPEYHNDNPIGSTALALTEQSSDLHRRIFSPPLRAPIYDVNVPFIAASKYFPKHAYLLELFPVVMRTDDVDTLLARDKDREAESVIRNGHEILVRTAHVFDHLTGPSNNPLSLSLVPLFYFYTSIGRFVRSSLYGFINWMMAGTEQDIRTRKIIFSAHRGRLEEILFSEDLAGAISRRAGSGLRGVAATAQFYQRLIELLNDDPSPVIEHGFHERMLKIISGLTNRGKKDSDSSSRGFTASQRTKINMREIFGSAIRCEICGGILDLRLGVQYDHVIPFAESRQTVVSQGRPTHPFCNNQRGAIEGHKSGSRTLTLPLLESSVQKEKRAIQQATIFDLFDSTVFPDEL